MVIVQLHPGRGSSKGGSRPKPSSRGEAKRPKLLLTSVSLAFFNPWIKDGLL